MRILHTSDWHLGHELASHRRETEHEAFLTWLLEQLDMQDADVLLVTGDIYDVANPPVSAMRRLFDFLRAATTRRPNLQVVVIGGNHDSAARIDLPSALLGEGRVRFVGAMPRAEGLPDCEALLMPLLDGDGAVGAWLAAVPFCRPGDLGTHTLSSLYKEVLDKGAVRAGDLPLVVTGHLHIAGGAVSELSERCIVIGGQEAEASSLFDERAAYVALGHLHRPQWIPGQVPIRYAGSPFPLSSTERNYRHSISVVSLARGKCEVSEIAIPRPVPFLALPEGGAAPLDQVIRAIEQLEIDASLPRESHPFLEVAVLVDGPEPHLQSRVLAALEGKPVRLTRIEKVTAQEKRTETRPLAGEDLAELQPGAVFEAMFRSEYSDGPPEELARAFDALLVEVETAGGDD
ncbi:MAG TPA: exonuclease SbcCD subunit D C-terminal domain-containing protein [Allosphingosinicella sp.]|nr:exonuclease SbcCD subunit D C-terminal domain-containing protein [Allosphingosinicella sp.]